MNALPYENTLDFTLMNALPHENVVDFTLRTEQLKEHDKHVSTLAVLQERQNLGRELHDSIMQSLYSINLIAQKALETIHTNPARATNLLEHVVVLTDAGLDETRGLLLELRPDLLETEKLTSTLKKRVQSLHVFSNLEVEMVLDDEPAISNTSKHALYRIVQEALHNIVKHAHANKVMLRLAQEEGGVVLEVCDDGRGFDPEDTSHTGDMSHTGLGLRSMRERVAHMNGTLTIKSAVGQGTSLRVAIPNISNEEA